MNVARWISPLATLLAVAPLAACSAAPDSTSSTASAPGADESTATHADALIHVSAVRLNKDNTQTVRQYTLTHEQFETMKSARVAQAASKDHAAAAPAGAAKAADPAPSEGESVGTASEAFTTQDPSCDDSSLWVFSGFSCSGSLQCFTGWTSAGNEEGHSTIGVSSFWPGSEDGVVYNNNAASFFSAWGPCSNVTNGQAGSLATIELDD